MPECVWSRAISTIAVCYISVSDIRYESFQGTIRDTLMYYTKAFQVLCESLPCTIREALTYNIAFIFS